MFLSSLGILAMLTDTGSLPKVGYLSDDHYNTSCYKTFKEGSVGFFFSFFLIYQQNKLKELCESFEIYKYDNLSNTGCFWFNSLCFES